MPPNFPRMHTHKPQRRTGQYNDEYPHATRLEIMQSLYVASDPDGEAGGIGGSRGADRSRL
ncbi:MAG: hypothetical protein H6937_10875 [Burkholderiales bacterium]|nr:hypothetical protein [Burkholderiales bacterium]